MRFLARGQFVACVVSVMALMLAVPASAQGLDTHDLTAVSRAYRQWFAPAQNTPPLWSGSVRGCQLGSETLASQQATIATVNFYRAMAGLPPVELDLESSHKALQTALMMAAQGQLSHEPGPGWACYTAQGAEAAGRSNLSLGRGASQAVAGQMADEGSGNEAVGHRRWILYPPANRMGTGSTPRSNALWVIYGHELRGPRPETPEFVAWPPPGWVPWEVGLAGSHDIPFHRWSLSSNAYPDADFRGATITMRALGQELLVTRLAQRDGYGDDTAVWTVRWPDGTRLIPGGIVPVEVQATGINVGDRLVDHAYTVTLYPGQPQVPRVHGPNRYATSAAVSAVSFPPQVPTVYVATGENYPDALAAAAAAGAAGGPVLLTRVGDLPAETDQELARLDPERIVLVGGETAVSEAVQTRLEDFAPVERIAAQNRYATAAAVSAEAFPDGAGTVYLATGADFPDALAAAAAAGAAGGPVLLTLPDQLPPEVDEEFERLAPERIVVVGGTAAVSDTVVQQASAHGQVTRVSGQDRFDTAARLAELAFPNYADYAHLATGANFPDAIAAAAAAIRRHGPVLLATRDRLPPSTATQLKRLRLVDTIVVGGAHSIAPGTHVAAYGATQ